LADEAGASSAQALFDDSKKLIAAGQYPEACPKLEESQKLDPATGTMFQLADCYEHTGRAASAWALFREIEAITKKAGETERMDIARGRGDALEPTLPKLTIQVDADAAGLEVTRDGVPVGKAQWGLPLPADEGEHVVTASAPGKKPWEGKVRMTSGAATGSITIPALEDAPLPPLRAAEQKPAGSGQKTLGLAVAGTGLLGMGIGTLLALGAKSTFNDSDSHCTGKQCDPEGVALRKTATGKGNVATAVFLVGTAALVGGGILWLTAPSSAPSTASASAAKTSRMPRVGIGPAGIAIGGAW
jgi:hypothetical protein